MRWLAIFALLLIVPACSKPQPAQPVVVREYITVPLPPAQIPPRPTLPSSRLAKEPTLGELIKALLADREALAAWAIDLETRLKAYFANGDTGNE